MTASERERVEVRIIRSYDVGHNKLDELKNASIPKPGCPGVRVDQHGREWYSSAWLDEAVAT